MAKDVLNKHTLGDEYEGTFNRVLNSKSSKPSVISKYCDSDVMYVTLIAWVGGVLFSICVRPYIINTTWLILTLVFTYFYSKFVKKYLVSEWNVIVRLLHKL